ncbi:MAG: type IV pilus assembly protein PilM [Parcubacteria group bacterium]|nr:type IV pilus assembly protein PilM [Parcubacteria group bacterium]MCR4342611.1 type IV pilus assembly protein PilM [Patescibacteria group bacterium]
MFNFRKKLPIGVDISDSSVEVLRLNGKREIVNHARIILPEGIVENGKIIDKEKLVLSLKEVLEKAGGRDVVSSSKKIKVVISLPESKVFVRNFELPIDLKNDDLKQEIMSEINKIAPSGLDTVYWDYVLVSTKKSHHILFVAVPKYLVDEYKEVAELAGLEVIIIDVEASSLGRALLKPLFLKANSMVVDIGTRTSDISIFGRDGLLHLSVSAPVAGSQLTQAVMDKLAKSREESEELKRTFGFNDNGEGHQISVILKNSFEEVLDKIKKAINYYQNNVNGKVEEIILAGGSSSLPGLDEYLEKSLGVKVKIGNPIEKLKNGQILNNREKQSVLFSNVIGLALRGLDDSWRGINLLPKVSGSSIKREVILKYLLSLLVGILILASLGYTFYSHRTKSQNQDVVPLVENSLISATSTDMISDEIDGMSIQIEEEIIKEEVIITNTPTGWLNVRSGPGTSYAQITKVYPKETYSLIEEKDDWYKITIDEKTEGWVISDYATIKSN